MFGRGRISEMMGDFGKGIKSFKKGMADEPDSPPAKISQQQAAPSADAKPSPAPAETGSANGGS
jgi:sec-independent protein translocase protein TatA